jgi:hypothetical protein
MCNFDPAATSDLHELRDQSGMLLAGQMIID